jgi:hypothetical protein
MIYTFVFEPDYTRLIPAILIDCRASIPEIKNQIGDVIKAYIDGQLALIDDTCIVYKIEEITNGVCAGIFVLKVDTGNKTANLLSYRFRPAFQNDTLNILNIIVNFITSSAWHADMLF